MLSNSESVKFATLILITTLMLRLWCRQYVKRRHFIIFCILGKYKTCLGKNYQQSTPYIVIGCIAIVSVAAMCFLPETKNTPLPDSMEDARKQEELR